MSKEATPLKVRTDKEQLIRVFEILFNNDTPTQKVNHLKGSMNLHKGEYFKEYKRRSKLKDLEQELERLKYLTCQLEEKIAELKKEDEVEQLKKEVEGDDFFD